MADKKAAGLAWIFNRPTEAPIAGSKALFFVGSPLMAEALAMRTAMEQAILLGYKDITFESDSMQLVKALTEHTQVAELHGIICDIVSSSVMFDSVNFQAIPRSVNGEADLLAKQALANFVTNL